MPKHELPPLPYAFDSLEPHIDAKTMEIHHGKHHAAYVANLNGALDKHPELFDRSLASLLAVPAAASPAMISVMRSTASSVRSRSLPSSSARPP